MGEKNKFYVCADWIVVIHLLQTTNLIINLDHDDWIFSDESKTLAESGFGACSRRSFLVPSAIDTRDIHASPGQQRMKPRSASSIETCMKRSSWTPRYFPTLHATSPRCDLTIAT